MYFHTYKPQPWLGPAVQDPAKGPQSFSKSPLAFHKTMDDRRVLLHNSCVTNEHSRSTLALQ